MAQDILSIFVYIFMITVIVTIVNLAIALFQVIKDLPSIRKKIWDRQNRGFRNIHNAHN